MARSRVYGPVHSRSTSRRPPARWRRVTGWLLRATARGMTCAPVLGLLLALYGLATHYVTAARETAPFRAVAWFDVRAEVGNVFYAAFANARDFLPHVATGEWSAAIANLTNMAGIRSDIYTRLLHARATNNAEDFVLAAPVLFAALLILRLLLSIIRRPAHPDGTVAWRHATDRLLTYGAGIALCSACFTTLLLNTVDTYQGLSGVAGLVGYLGSGLSTVVDAVAAGSVALKEFIWHSVFLLTDGKEKTLGMLTHSQPLEDLSHYLDRFPAARIPAALHTAVFQAALAAVAWALAHFVQRKAHARAAAPSPTARRQKAPVRRPRRRRGRATAQP